jgi:hypothetical protein
MSGEALDMAYIETAVKLPRTAANPLLYADNEPSNWGLGKSAAHRPICRVPAVMALRCSAP